MTEPKEMMMGAKIKFAFFVFFCVVALFNFAGMTWSLSTGDKINACFYAIWAIFFIDRMEGVLK